MRLTAEQIMEENLFGRMIQPLRDAGAPTPDYDASRRCWVLRLPDPHKDQRSSDADTAIKAAYRFAGLDIPPHVQELMK